MYKGVCEAKVFMGCNRRCGRRCVWGVVGVYGVGGVCGVW